VKSGDVEAYSPFTLVRYLRTEMYKTRCVMKHLERNSL